MLYDYQCHLAQCDSEGVQPRPLTPEQVAALLLLLEHPPAFEEPVLIALFEQHVGHDVRSQALKHAFLQSIVEGSPRCNLIGPATAQRMLEAKTERAAHG
ncbi:hypothetical protein LZ023_14655 [Pseudomonas silvicola]|nr:hypothetical protein LZ023_14655 [Pseudomonas silvicola]